MNKTQPLSENSFFKDKFWLAPLAGYSDLPFRLISRKGGADVTVSEMVSVKGIIYKKQRTFSIIYMDPSDRPFGIQLFGNEPSDFAEAARSMAEKFNPDFIDINCGCPVQKVLKQKAGAALMQDPDRVAAITAAVRAVITIPLTVKIRTGWDKKIDDLSGFARRIEDAGADAIIIHGRTKSQLFSGEIDYKAIEEVKKAVKIPIVGNGNITDLASLKKMRETGCDSVMIGRAATGDPYLFRELKEQESGKEISVTPGMKLDILEEHFKAFMDYYKTPKYVMKFRALGAQYIKKTVRKKALLRKLFQVVNETEMKEMFLRMRKLTQSPES
jgi:tRNA-dihydrouridine synthase B